MLDLDTLVLFGLVLALALAIGLSYALGAQPLSDPRSSRASRIWLLSVAAHAGFWLLFFFGHDLPPPVSIVFVNSLSVLPMAGYLYAVRAFLGRPGRGMVLLGLVAIALVGNAWYSLADPSYHGRALAVSLPGAVLMLWLARTVLRHQQPGTGRAARFMAVVFGLGGAALLLRVADGVFGGGRMPTESPLQQAALLVYAALPAFASLGFLLMQSGRSNAALLELASSDPLTGALNRRAFDAAARKTLAGCKRTARAASLLMIDVDRFKQVNDGHGHDIGDRMLVLLHACLAATLREEDVLGRLGGEEFMALLPGARQAEALVVAERLRAAVESMGGRDAPELPSVTVSIGVAEWDRMDTQVDQLLRRADQAMYEAKRGGRNRVAGAAPQSPG